MSYGPTKWDWLASAVIFLIAAFVAITGDTGAAAYMAVAWVLTFGRSRA